MGYIRAYRTAPQRRAQAQIAMIIPTKDLLQKGGTSQGPYRTTLRKKQNMPFGGTTLSWSVASRTPQSGGPPLAFLSAFCLCCLSLEAAPTKPSMKA